MPEVGEAQSSVARGYPYVTGQCQLEALVHRDTVDGDDHRFGDSGEMVSRAESGNGGFVRIGR